MITVNLLVQLNICTCLTLKAAAIYLREHKHFLQRSVERSCRGLFVLLYFLTQCPCDRNKAANKRIPNLISSWTAQLSNGSWCHWPIVFTFHLSWSTIRGWDGACVMSSSDRRPLQTSPKIVHHWQSIMAQNRHSCPFTSEARPWGFPILTLVSLPSTSRGTENRNCNNYNRGVACATTPWIYAHKCKRSWCGKDHQWSSAHFPENRKYPSTRMEKSFSQHQPLRQVALRVWLVL